MCGAHIRTRIKHVRAAHHDARRGRPVPSRRMRGSIMRARAESRARDERNGSSSRPLASPTERAVSALSAPRRPPPRHIEPTTYARPRQHHSTTCRGVAVRARTTLTIDQCSPPRQRVSGPTKIASCVLVAVAAVAPRCCSRPSCLPAKCRCDGWVIPTPPPRPQQET